MRQVVLDTETTGISVRDGNRILEIGCVEMIDRKLTGNHYHVYVNPERESEEGALRVHGITTEFLSNKPLYKDVAQSFFEFIKGAQLVIHNAPFDIKFLNHELSLVNLPSLELAEAIDTLTIARKTFPGARVNLDALCRRFKVDNSSRDFHGALLDAALLAEVYVELTGGRQTSFSMSGKLSDKSSNQNLAIKAEGNKIVISPTKEELFRHEEFIVKFIKK